MHFPLNDDHFQGGENLTPGGTTDPTATLPRLLNELNARVYSNSTRPDASTLPVGTMIFNIDDLAPNWGDGTNWRDSEGNIT